MKTYDSYKDSGIEWIGEIPNHWKAIPMRFLLRRRITDGPHETPKFLPDGVPFLSVDGIQDGELVFEGCRKISEEDHEKYKQKCVVEKHDILMGKAASVGKVAQVKVDFEFSIWSPLALLKPNHDKITSAYFEYFLKSTYAKDNANILSTFNTQQNISMTDIPRIYYVIPNSVEEQTAIANYLDCKTTEIDELIADKKRLLELYEEEKSAVINQAVTKGINPDAPMKDSGIEWLGEIPEHWEVKKLKMIVTKVGSGVTPSGGSSVYLKEGIPLLRSQNIHFNGLKLEDVAYISEEIDQGMSNSRIMEDDILLNITGASIGRCFYVPKGFGKGNVNQHVCIIRPILGVIHPIYLYFLIRSSVGQVQINLQQTGANREGLNFEQLKNFTLPIPKSISEQETIVESLRNSISKIDANISKTEKLIDLLTEYRTALISEVVTGKVKVID